MLPGDQTAPPIIDSHIHLFPSSELLTLAWCPPSHHLHTQCSVDEYLAATAHTPSLLGFIFIETDRKSRLARNNQYGWNHALQEIDWIARIARGLPRPGEGHEPQHARLVLGVVPWAPVPLGEEGLREYVRCVEERIDSCLVKGFRHLVQDKARGTMVHEGFVGGLRWLGREGYTFDLGVDFRSGGKWQLDEAVEMIGRAHEDTAEGQRVVVVISMLGSCLIYFHWGSFVSGADGHVDHMCKPDMYLDEFVAAERTAVFAQWRTSIKHLARFSNTYMKLSGAFSEMPRLSSSSHGCAEPWTVTEELRNAKRRCEPWVSAVFQAFGPERVMFGSDWPVCDLGGGGSHYAWRNWWWVVDEIMRDLGLSEDEKNGVWSGVAREAYRLS